MKRFTFLFSSILLFTATLHAQQGPWANLPATKKISNIINEEKTLYLKLDTLVAEEKAHPDSQFKYELSNWYKAPSNKVGYGYVTEDGKPVGIWRYYILANNKYELFCEGYFENLIADYLEADPGYANHLTSANSKELKESFVNGLEQKAFFTGEWRFYKEGKLRKMVMLGKKVALPLITSMTFNDAGEVSSAQLLITYPNKIHLAGQELSAVYFSPKGMVTHMTTHGIDLKFSKEGKPLIEPLYEPDVLDEY